MNDKLLMIAVAAVALVAGLLIGTTMLQPFDDTWNDEDNGLTRIVSELEEHGGEIHVIDPRNSYYGTSYLIEAGDSIEIYGDKMVIKGGTVFIPYHSISYVSINH